MSTHEILVGKRPPSDHPGQGRAKFWVIVLVLIMVALAVIGIVIRMIAHAHLNQRTQAESVPTVSVVKPTAGPGEDDVTLPGNLQAFVDAPLYARTDGYLKAWYFDIGAHVKKGQLIAVIETPELDQQLDQARAALASAKANYDIAVLTNKRYQALVKTAAVSKQEADQNAANEAAQKAAVDSAAANVKHFEALQSFEKITAPFDGVVTERNTDVGQLVTSGIGASGGSGTGSTNRELFRVTSTDKLRTFVDVPQNQSPYVTEGAKADIHLVERPDQTYQGIVTRTSRAIDNTSRTLLTEIDIDNRNGELLPGAYVDVHLHVPSDNVTGAMRVPANTLIFRAKGMQLAVVGGDNKVHLHDVQIGRDFGNVVEIVAGVDKDDQIVVNPPDSLADGQDVKTAKEEPAKTTAAQDGHTEKKPDATKDDGKASAQKKDVPPSRGSTEPVAKASRAPDAPKSDTGGGSNATGQAGQVSDQAGKQPASGQTMPGTDGNGAK